MTAERHQLEAGIAALEAQRAILGDGVVDAALAGLRAKLAALAGPAPEPEQHLRQVTILFLDVVGSTVLGQKLDPEEFSGVMDGVLSRGTRIVERQGGRVLHYAGDNLLAAFGADEVREDDAERAVQCGLALLELGRLAGTEVLAAHGHAGLDVRVGLHTGGVLLGGGVDAEGTIRGSAVNIAARMEQTAPPGGMRISHETYTQVRGVFEVAAEPPIAVKGLAEPVATYLVQGVKARAFRVTTRGIEGVETRMFGRDDEFEVLKDAFKRLFVEPKLAAVSIVGEAGLGKSRLIYEFSNWSEARPENFLIFQGRATPQTPDQPYGLLRDIVAWRWQIADGDSMAVAKAKLEAGLIPLFEQADTPADAEAHTHLLGFLIGLDYAESRHLKPIKDDQKQIRNRAFFAAAEMFRRIAADRHLPIIMQLDDLHWADDPSLDFLFYLSQAARDVPLLIVGVMRGTLFERRDAWIGAAPHRRIDLRPLGKGVSRELANELLKQLPEVPSALRELVSDGADGNPFYMEELVKMLIDQGAITVGERWTLHPDKLVATQVPATLTGVLQARLDGLPPAERLALQEASIIGMVFWDQALAALDAASAEVLPDLARRELALPQQDASLTGMREYAFKHQILHQVTLETVLKRIRRNLHAKAGDWFAGLTDARASEYLAVAAQHYAAAGEDAKACEYFTRAAEQAKVRFASAAALDWIDRALTLIERVADADRPALHWRLLDARERTYEIQGRREEQGADLTVLAALADRLGDRSRAAEVAYRQSHRALRMGDVQTQAEAARRSVAMAEAAGDTTWRLMAQRLLATATDEVLSGMALAEAGLEEARALGLRSIEAAFLNALTVLEGRRGDLVAAQEYNLQTLAIHTASGDRRVEMIARSNLANGEAVFGRFAAARREAGVVLSAARAMGDRVLEGTALALLADIALGEGEETQALAHAEAARTIAIETQGREREMEALTHRADAELLLGRIADAAGSFARVAELAREIGHYVPDALAGLARVALAQRDPGAAVVYLEPVLAALATEGTDEGEHDRAKNRLICWKALTAAGDPRASRFLELAHDEVQATAARISDPDLKESFLANHPTNRAIIAAWAERA